MISVLRYGNQSAVELEIEPAALLADCKAPRGSAIADVPAAVAEAIQKPLEFPSLSQAAVPGDRVVLALDQAVPQSAAIVAVVVQELLTAGVSAHDISILCANVAQPCDPREQLDEDLHASVQLATHDPADRGQLSYLGATHEGKPIYVNRLIYDADLVITIGCLRLEESLGYHGVSGSLFPTFSDSKSLQRYRSPAAVESPVQHKRLSKEADEVLWQLGAMFTVQVVPGAGEDVLHVLAGETAAVFAHGKQLCAAAWSFEVPRRASLVVAGIEGDASQQTWENVARALSAALRAVATDGSIALCTDLTENLGPALQQLAAADDRQAALRRIIKERPGDALPATQLLHALERGRVYLLSRLQENVVEELGIAPVSNPEQLARLTSHHDSCIVLSNAQYALATPQDE